MWTKQDCTFNIQDCNFIPLHLCTYQDGMWTPNKLLQSCYNWLFQLCWPYSILVTNINFSPAGYEHPRSQRRAYSISTVSTPYLNWSDSLLCSLCQVSSWYFIYLQLKRAPQLKKARCEKPNTQKPVPNPSILQQYFDAQCRAMFRNELRFYSIVVSKSDPLDSGTAVVCKPGWELVVLASIVWNPPTSSAWVPIIPSSL